MRIDRRCAVACGLAAALRLAVPGAAIATPRLVAQAQTPAPAPTPDAAPVTPPVTAAPAEAPAVPVAAPPPATAAPVEAGGNRPPDLSPWAMFLHADRVVKSVMVGLALASVAVWTVWLVKGATLLGATRRARRAVAALRRVDGLDAEAVPAGRAASGPVLAMVEAARDEVRRSVALPAEGIKERAALSVQRIEARATRAMARGTGLVATVGAVAPFVGLFGTVWGILDSFVGISRAHTSNLAVVAPGIAEALLATAIGLVAAIPAVVIFNGFARATAGYRALLADAAADVMRHLSRDLDRRDAGARHGRQAAE